jgi:hypothetical protein
LIREFHLGGGEGLRLVHMFFIVRVVILLKLSTVISKLERQAVHDGVNAASSSSLSINVASKYKSL